MNSGLFSLLESPTIGSMKKYALITFLTLVSLAPLTATAQTIDVLRQFIYGDLTIVDNDAPRDLIIAPNGDITANPSHIVVLSDGDSARIRLQSFPGNTTITVSFAATDVLHDGIGPQYFSISDAVTDPATITTDPGGSATFNVGTTLSTSGNGNYYSDGAYTGEVEITANF